MLKYFRGGTLCDPLLCSPVGWEASLVDLETQISAEKEKESATHPTSLPILRQLQWQKTINSSSSMPAVHPAVSI
ncbi:Hypothetical predicted protein [Pelobates cultripes]|uniref:Uncharacterized protein n=1 Tax=Pelobates cultripes TaxID=61616 RepID=A0AAD1R8R0_PELCU|nr:Hypothetical predicted protein [Pelobates cultripes]